MSWWDHFGSLFWTCITATVINNDGQNHSILTRIRSPSNSTGMWTMENHFTESINIQPKPGDIQSTKQWTQMVPWRGTRPCRSCWSKIIYIFPWRLVREFHFYPLYFIIPVSHCSNNPTHELYFVLAGFFFYILYIMSVLVNDSSFYYSTGSSRSALFSTVRVIRFIEYTE